MMKTTQIKAFHFLTALADVYRDEEDRELSAFSKLDFSSGDDVTDDFVAILLAMHLLLLRLSDFDGDLIDFTHVLNKLAVQHLMEREGDDNEGEED